MICNFSCKDAFFLLSKLAGQNSHFINGVHNFQGSGHKFLEKLHIEKIVCTILKKFKGLKYKAFFH